MIKNDLDWLLEWYNNQCDSDWEHENGIKIGTLDNPGWYLKVMLNGTPLETKPFDNLEINRSEHDWIYCSIKDNIFQGFGGPFNLPEILQIFRKWSQLPSKIQEP